MNVQHKKVEWIELYFDLVYVVAIASLTHAAAHLLEHGHVRDHYILFASVMGVIWWSWAGNTMYANRFKKGDAYYIVLTMIQMVLVLVLSLFVAGALTDTIREFSLAYVGIRLVTIALYVRIHRTQSDKRGVTRVFLTGFSLSALVWLVASFLPAPYAMYLWGLGVLIDFMTGYSVRSTIENVAPPSTEHLPERVGLLAMIIMGEAIVGVTVGLTGGQLLSDGGALVRFFVSFAAICAVWWAYFRLSESFLAGRISGSGQDIIRAHYVVYTGLGMFAEFIHLFTRAHTPASTLGMLLVISLTLIFAPMAYVSWRHGRKPVNANI